MQMFKRIGLFFLVNIMVITTISIFLNVVLPLLGIRIDPSSMIGLMFFCLAWGMGGSIISLFLSKWLVKISMGVEIIDPETSNPQGRRVIGIVYRVARKAGLDKMPEVGIYEAPELNAFATGPSRNNSLVAVSTGLLQSMDDTELEGVIGHEVTHITNGDMVTMTLIQGVVNAFAMFFSRIIARIIANSVDSKASYMVQMLVTIVLDIAFTILGSIVVAYFSRIREYKADQGGASLAGREKMVAGLRKLKAVYERLEPDNSTMAVMKISSRPAGVMALFMTHPPLDERIRRLQEG